MRTMYTVTGDRIIRLTRLIEADTAKEAEEIFKTTFSNVVPRTIKSKLFGGAILRQPKVITPVNSRPARRASKG